MNEFCCLVERHLGWFYILGVCTLTEWAEYFNGLSKFQTGSTGCHLLCVLAVISISDLWKLKKKKNVCEHNAHTDMNMWIFIVSWSLPSQFTEVSHPQVEAFNLDGGVTQPQLSPAAAAAIVPRLKIQWKSGWGNGTRCWTISVSVITSSCFLCVLFTPIWGKSLWTHPLKCLEPSKDLRTFVSTHAHDTCALKKVSVKSLRLLALI